MELQNFVTVAAFIFGAVFALTDIGADFSLLWIYVRTSQKEKDCINMETECEMDCFYNLSKCTAEVMRGQHCSYNLSKCSAGGMSPTPAIHCFNDSEECGENCGKDFNECFQGIGNYPEMFNRNQSV